MHFVRTVLFVAVWLHAATAFAQLVTTVAGSGGAGYNGDDPTRTALTANLYFPIGIAVDSAGNVFVADSSNHRVRKVTPAGVITTVAGTGQPGSDSASLAVPSAVAVDSAGNLYIADTYNSRVQKIAAGTGTVTTVAGTGAPGVGGDGIAANASALAYPRGVAIDSSGNLYISDTDNHRVRKVVGGTVSNLAGSAGTPGCTNANLNFPRGLAVAAGGDVFIADAGNHRVTKVTGASMSLFAGAADCSAGAEEGPATSGARFNFTANPFAADVAVTSTNDVLVADPGNSRIRRIRLGTVSTVAGSTTGFSSGCAAATNTQFNSPRGVAAVAGSPDFFISDFENNRVRKVANGAPCPPILDSITGGQSQASLAFTPGYDGGSAVTAFNASCTPGPLTGTNSASPIVVTGMTNGTQYTCSVTATTALGTSSASNTLQVTPGAPTLSLSTTSIDFGGQSMGTTSPTQSVTLTNTGSVPITVTQLSAPNTQFAYTHNCTNIAAAATCTISATFSPAPSVLVALNGSALVTTNLSITSNATGSPHTVGLAGLAEKSLVTHYYRSILRRDPDAGGKSFWASEAQRVANLPANVNEAWFSMAGAFFNSAEYLAFNRNPSEYVTDLYITFFNRAPDSDGLNFWVGQMASGMPREVVLVSFMFSTEFVNFTTAIFGNTAVRPERDAVMDFYRGFLGRLPDDGGFNFWVNRFRTAQCQGAGAVTAEADEISSQFMLSGEYTARNRTNAQFVADLYNAFLRRGGDLGGVNFWINEITAGARTRDNVRVQFRNSPEFDARVQAIINAGCQS